MYLATNIMLSTTVHQFGEGVVCNKEFNRRIEYIF